MHLKFQITTLLLLATASTPNPHSIKEITRPNNNHDNKMNNYRKHKYGNFEKEC